MPSILDDGINMTKYKRIFIVGHSGVGKALAGQSLADKFGWQFVDGDIGLENRIGRSLHEIVGKHAEEARSE